MRRSPQVVWHTITFDRTDWSFIYILCHPSNAVTREQSLIYFSYTSKQDIPEVPAKKQSKNKQRKLFSNLSYRLICSSIRSVRISALICGMVWGNGTNSSWTDRLGMITDNEGSDIVPVFTIPLKLSLNEMGWDVFSEGRLSRSGNPSMTHSGSVDCTSKLQTAHYLSRCHISAGKGSSSTWAKFPLYTLAWQRGASL